MPPVINTASEASGSASFRTSGSISAGALLVVGTVLVVSGVRLDAFTFGDTSAAALGLQAHLGRTLPSHLSKIVKKRGIAAIPD